MDFQGCETILLTGAGFTHNFGTPLAQGIWSEIFNHRTVQNTPRVRELMLENFDYELVYFEILEGDYDDEEKDAISDGVNSAYESIDAQIRAYNWQPGSSFPVNLNRLNKFISLFYDKNIHGFVFTLNQDLFVERRFLSEEMPVIPGILNNPDWFISRFSTALSQGELCKLPNDTELKAMITKLSSLRKFFYIKLHGSSNWVDSSGNRKMVVGRGKEEVIQKEPLLKWYFDIFKGVLFQPERRLLIVGYGFGDGHINKILAEAVTGYGLKIYIVNPTSPEEHYRSLAVTSGADGIDIWSGLSGYYPYTLGQIFPADQSLTVRGESLHYDLFVDE